MEIKQLLNDIQGLLFEITRSRRIPIENMGDIYAVRLNRKRCDALLIEVQRHLKVNPADQPNPRVPKWVSKAE